MQGGSIPGQGKKIPHAAGQLSLQAKTKTQNIPQKFCNKNKKHINLSMLCSPNPSSIQPFTITLNHCLIFAPPTTDCWLAPSNFASLQQASMSILTP